MSQDKTDKHPQQLVQDYLDALLFDPDETPVDKPDPEDGVVDAGETDPALVGDIASGSLSPHSDPTGGPTQHGTANTELVLEAKPGDPEARADAAMIAAFAQSGESGETADASDIAKHENAESRADADMIAAYGANAETELPKAAETPAVAAPAARPVDNPTLAYRPACLGDEFNTVLVRMHGLRLAVPFNQVEGVQHLKGLSLALDREHDWVLGRYQSRTGPVRVVDTALRLIPERYNPALARYEEALVLPGRHWALACDELLQSLNLRADQISWNGDRAARPWLLGTCSTERCFLIDIPALLIQLDDAFSVSADPRGIL